MSNTDAFALANSGLSRFLFSEVGTEINDSPLTILSVLARLGKDPWAEAARWAGLPRDVVIDLIAASIAKMPLTPQALADGRQTAARLVVLLPKVTVGGVGGALPMKGIAVPNWLTLALLVCALALGFVVSSAWPQPAGVAPNVQSIQPPTPPRL